jgi:hypothetical protein
MRVAVVTPRRPDYHLPMQGDATNESRSRDDVRSDARVERLPGRDGDAELTVRGARATDRISVRPSLFAELHRPFALRPGERFAARCLLALLRLPGGPRLLRAWHARRGS